MKLITMSKTDTAYTVKARKTLRIAGQELKSNIMEYTFSLDRKEWYTSQGKKVSSNKKKYLNKWLKDHQKFIENN